MNAGDLTALSAAALGRLMPMYLLCDHDGRILSLGPTLAKVLGGAGADPVGMMMPEYFVLRGTPSNPQDACVLSTLRERRRVHLGLRDAPGISLRGASVDLGPAGVLFNLTFGIHLVEAVREFDLTETDFAASDMAIELLYMAEANVAVLGELRALTGRLDIARRSAEAQALSDPLTGLANRRGLDQAIEAEIAARMEGGAAFAIGHLDLDYFKQVNDTHGHSAGDHVLMMVAQRLTRELRRGDLVARTGGDEFLLLLRDSRDETGLLRLGERLIEKIEQPYVFEGKTCRISASIGIAIAPSDGASLNGQIDVQRLMDAADRALYSAKRAGRGRCAMAQSLEPIENRAGRSLPM